jgi:hypothetical protein
MGLIIMQSGAMYFVTEVGFEQDEVVDCWGSGERRERQK